MNNFCKTGFTLIEMVVVIVILSIIISVGGTLLGVGYRGGFASQDSIYAASIARAAFERMSDEIKEARAANSSDLTPNTNSITFTTITGETITYSLSGTDLMRNSQILADYFSSLSFTYLDASNNTTTTPANVRCIVINAVVTYKDITINLKTSVCPRNYVL